MPELNAIGIVVSDVGRSIAFYRLLGVDFPEEGEGHIEATLPSGTRFMLDEESVEGDRAPDVGRHDADGVQLRHVDTLALAVSVHAPPDVSPLPGRPLQLGRLGCREAQLANEALDRAQRLVARERGGDGVDDFRPRERRR